MLVCAVSKWMVESLCVSLETIPRSVDVEWKAIIFAVTLSTNFSIAISTSINKRLSITLNKCCSATPAQIWGFSVQFAWWHFVYTVAFLFALRIDTRMPFIDSWNWKLGKENNKQETKEKRSYVHSKKRKNRRFHLPILFQHNRTF